MRLEAIALGEEFASEMMRPYNALPLFGNRTVPVQNLELSHAAMIEANTVTINLDTKEKYHAGHLFKDLIVHLNTRVGRDWASHVGTAPFLRIRTWCPWL